MTLGLTKPGPIGACASLHLDAARWIAAVLVVIYHIRINLVIDPALQPAACAGLIGRAFYLITMAGPQGVAWFFVISGYLVGGTVAAQLTQGRFDFRQYAFRRAVRLYPVLIPALLIGLGLDSWRIATFGISVAPPAGAETAASYTIATFAGNLVFLQTFLVPTLGSNLPLWSLAGEAWYYALFPMLLAPLMGGRPRAQRALLFGAALVLVAIGLHLNRSIMLMSVDWLIGVGVRLVSRPLMRSLTVAWLLAAIALLAAPVLHGLHVPLTYFVPVVAFANVLLTASHKAAPRGHGLAGIHARLAGFSYSLYLVHAPMLHFLLTMLYRQGNPRIGLEWNATSMAIGIVLLLALMVWGWLFSLLTERRTDTLRNWLARRFA